MGYNYCYNRTTSIKSTYRRTNNIKNLPEVIMCCYSTKCHRIIKLTAMKIKWKVKLENCIPKTYNKMIIIPKKVFFSGFLVICVVVVVVFCFLI